MESKSVHYNRGIVKTSLSGWLYLLLLLTAAFFFSCSNKNDSKAMLFVASSLNQSLTKVAESLQTSEVLINSASSGTLARQIEAGAPCDLYFSANKKWIDYLLSCELADSSNVEQIAQNTLVLISASENTAIFDTLSLLQCLDACSGIALGDPSHVPSGDYTKTALVNAGVYSKHRSKMIETKDVVSAMRLVELNEVDLAFVYKTDAMSSSKVKILNVVSDSLYAEINYYALSLSAKGKDLLSNMKFKTVLREILSEKGFE
jgi:molybdate transport system substrate-binding protein